MGFALKTLIAAVSLAGVAHAAEITFFKQPAFAGGQLTLRDGRSDLAGSGMMNQASSAVVRSGRWEICTQPDFTGDCVTLGPGEYSNLDSRIYHRIESVRPLDRYAGDEPRRYSRYGSIELYTGPRFRGHVTRVERDERSLSDADIYGTSSLVVHEGTWELCSDTGYRGNCRVFEPGRYPNIGRLDNAVSSVRRIG